MNLNRFAKNYGRKQLDFRSDQTFYHFPQHNIVKQYIYVSIRLKRCDRGAYLEARTTAAPNEREQRPSSSEMPMDVDRSERQLKLDCSICHCLWVSPWQRSLDQKCHCLWRGVLSNNWLFIEKTWPHHTNRPSPHHPQLVDVLRWRACSGTKTAPVTNTRVCLPVCKCSEPVKLFSSVLGLNLFLVFFCSSQP